jgi:hypothetical protein
MREMILPFPLAVSAPFWAEAAPANNDSADTKDTAITDLFILTDFEVNNRGPGQLSPAPLS